MNPIIWVLSLILAPLVASGQAGAISFQVDGASCIVQEVYSEGEFVVVQIPYIAEDFKLSDTGDSFQRLIIGDQDTQIAWAAGIPLWLKWDGLAVQVFLVNPLTMQPMDGLLWQTQSRPDEEVYFFIYSGGRLVDAIGVHIQAYASVG
jgi:hypothetical protein